MTDDWPQTIRIHEKQLPEGATTIDGEFLRYCFVSACDGIPYHHDDVVRELREAARGIADHELFYDREYLSRELNEKLDALRAALAKLDGGE